MRGLRPAHRGGVGCGVGRRLGWEWGGGGARGGWGGEGGRIIFVIMHDGFFRPWDWTYFSHKLGRVAALNDARQCQGCFAHDALPHIFNINVCMCVRVNCLPPPHKKYIVKTFWWSFHVFKSLLLLVICVHDNICVRNRHHGMMRKIFLHNRFGIRMDAPCIQWFIWLSLQRVYTRPPLTITLPT